VVSSKFAALIGAWLAAAMVYGQVPVPRRRVPSAERLFQPSPEEKPLACEVRPIAPELSYRLVIVPDTWPPYPWASLRSRNVV